ncbi:MAG: hypothetical protein M1837_002806 [Sclerophora amabilis]|nr:MAG: hypothetical protein M1837_002806 [Sclerophora amabilis]
MARPSNKRKLEDPNQSDPDDEDYDATAKRSSRPAKSGNRPPKKAKKSRREYASDASEISESDDVGEESFGADDVEEEVPELDERTGRPKRTSTKRTVKYEETSDDSEGLEVEEESVIPSSKPSKMVKLALGHSSRAKRVMRALSAPRGRHGSSAEPTSASTRRSNRLHHDEQDPILALTDSGRHAQIIRPGTRSPEAETSRPRRGGKGIKAPAPSAIFEDEEGISVSRSQEHAEDDPAFNTQGREFGGKSVSRSRTSDDTGGMAKPELREDLATEVDVAAGRATIPGGHNFEDGEDEDPVELPNPPPADDEEDDEEGPVAGTRRSKRTAHSENERRRTQASRQERKARGAEHTSDFEFDPSEPEEENVSSSESSQGSPRKASQNKDDEGDESSNTRKSGRLAKASSKMTVSGDVGVSESEERNGDEAEELAEELEELQGKRQITYQRAAPKLRNRKKAVDYRILRPDLLVTDDAEPQSAVSPARRGRGGGGSWQRSLFSTYGPFGGAAGLPPVFGGPAGTGATGGVDSDSSDDERMPRSGGLGGGVGMTPTTAAAPGLLPPPQTHGADPTTGQSGTPANLGKIKDRKALADADPLGVDQNVDFDSVGGLQDQINQLKEMVSLPLLYPEIFQRFHVTPPRGVLFHGPPGTGKTLLARALAASVSSQGRKITFYMRKGADALSKWVGEAERQLRLLFDEARNNQPSIIFFDEIDGLAPVRSSKQEQIHASIVSTLLALMDGMDGRGQVIVIGATNRPDSIDPALRRPGRFDREFYFPLPSTIARRSIIDIHTKEWTPGLSSDFKDQLAAVTKGYGGADLRALCTEAALNAVQRRYPQIYSSNEKLKIDPSTITITAKDFMISVKKLVPSSERSASSGAAPLPRHIEPLLRNSLLEIRDLIGKALPQKKRLTALEEAQYEEYHDPDGGFQREQVEQDFETSRIFRPRLLIRGQPGMGQHYLAAALLNHFEGLHVQSFDLPTLLSDSTRSSEAALIQLFAEVRRHKPSVIYIPNVDSWYRAVGPIVISTFLGLLRSLPPTEPVLLLGFLENEVEQVDKGMLKDLFGFSQKNQYELTRPDKPSRRAYFGNITGYIRKAPSDFPDPDNRKRRKLEELEVAPPPSPPRPPTKEEQQAQKKKDRQVLNLLKIKIQPIMDQIKLKYRKFRTGVVEDDQIRYIYEEDDPNLVTTDATPRQLFRPFEKSRDKEGVPGLLEVASDKFYYNLNIQIIEERLSNGWYKRPKDFLTDIRCLAKDSKMSGDRDRTLKANELLANVEVDMAMLESDPYLVDCENVHNREMQRLKDKESKHARAAAAEANTTVQAASIIATAGTGSNSDQPPSGPVQLGEPVPPEPPALPITPSRPSAVDSHLSNGYSAGPTGHTSDPKSQTSRSNGSSVPSRHDGDVHMADSEEGSATQRFGPQSGPYESHEPSQQSQPFWGTLATQRDRAAASNPSGANTQRSQKSLLTAMPPGAHPDEFANSASTTTSGKKTSDNSNPSSGPWNTQSSNGVGFGARRDVPDFSGIESKGHGDSQLPDTQGSSFIEMNESIVRLTDETEVASSQGSGGPSSQSQPNSHQGSQPPVPPFSAPSRQATSGSIQSILNNAPQGRGPEKIMDVSFIDSLHEQFTERTSGCTIEQIEQINTALMDSVWKQRGEWNRTKVGKEVMEVFNEIILDIDAMQEIFPASLATQ